jgi:hypothetical protein
VIRAGLIASVALITGTPSVASKPVVSVGALASEKTCTLYKLTAGQHREAGIVNPYGAAYASQTTWRDYLVRDCIDHFASLRTSIQAALASSGRLTIAPGERGGYVVTGRISEVSGGGPAAPAEAGPGGFAISTSDMLVNMDVTVKDPQGQIVFGGLLTKKLQTGFNMETSAFSSSSSQSGKAIYTELQHQVALAVARLVAFHVEPLRVTGIEGEEIQLNYGAPLLQVGTLVQVTGAHGMMRFNVTSAADGSAQAELDGDGDVASISQGMRATVVEADDPAANGRRFRKVDLP